MAERDEKEWTLMFYFASDNPLAPEIVSQLKAITQAGFHPEVNVIAQFDPHDNDNRTHIFDVNGIKKLEADGESKIGFVGFTPNDPYVVDLMTDKIWGDEKDAQGKLITDRIREALRKAGNFNPPSLPKPEGEDKSKKGKQAETKNRSLELSPEKSLRRFLKFCRDMYPARHYMLFILGHGLVVGNALFLFDENAEQPSLKLQTLGKLLKEFKDKIKSHAEFELISFHSCSMSSLEVAYELQEPTDELQGIANYMIASQGPAFVGSWPYRQILIRVFNDVRKLFFTVGDLKDAAGLVTKLKTGEDTVSKQLRSRFASDTKKLLTQYSGPEPPSRQLRAALVAELNRVLKKSDLQQTQEPQSAPRSKAAKPPGKPSGRESDQRLLDRESLAKAYPEEQLSRKSKIDVKEMVTKIFYYCLYNSYDFLIAGYSFDLCLCDLNKVPNIKTPLSQLSKAMIDGLKDPKVHESILLAHWDAQSFWEENFIDLFDFCFCLKRRLNSDQKSKKLPPKLKAITTACEKMMGKLEKEVKDTDDRFIVRAEFAGPKYQYSHGMSVFFPWSAPNDVNFWTDAEEKSGEYQEYKFVKEFGDDPSWNNFLSAYFRTTQRDPRATEIPVITAPNLQRDLLRDLLEEFATRVFNESGQLSKGGGSSSTGDSDCACPSIKNYPPFLREGATVSRRGGPVSREEVPVSQTFLEAPDVLKERAFLSELETE